MKKINVLIKKRGDKDVQEKHGLKTEFEKTFSIEQARAYSKRLIKKYSDS